MEDLLLGTMLLAATCGYLAWEQFVARIPRD